MQLREHGTCGLDIDARMSSREPTTDYIRGYLKPGGARHYRVLQGHPYRGFISAPIGCPLGAASPALRKINRGKYQEDNRAQPQ